MVASAPVLQCVTTRTLSLPVRSRIQSAPSRESSPVGSFVFLHNSLGALQDRLDAGRHRGTHRVHSPRKVDRRWPGQRMRSTSYWSRVFTQPFASGLVHRDDDAECSHGAERRRAPHSQRLDGLRRDPRRSGRGGSAPRRAEPSGRADGGSWTRPATAMPEPSARLSPEVVRQLGSDSRYECNGCQRNRMKTRQALPTATL